MYLSSSIITILLPVFASYKALRAADLAQLSPWLIYWIILSLILLVESWTVFILGWLPFYSWVRLFVLSYLVLPQTQGAKLLYTNYVEPFIASHEHQIEVFIGDLHEQGSKAGLGYLKQLIDLIRQRAFGLPPTRPNPPAPATPAGYAQSLLSRFAMPSARAPTTSDFYSLLSGAVAAATFPGTTTRTLNPTSNTNNNNPLLIPAHLTSNADKQTFLTSQREKLAVLIKALDREQRDLDLAYGNSPPGLANQSAADSERRMRENPSSPFFFGPSHDAGSSGGSYEMRKNKSDNSFHNIEREEFEGESVPGDDDEENRKQQQKKKKEERQGAGRRTASGGGWNPTSWFGGVGGGGDDASEAAKDVRRDVAHGISSGVDRPR